MFSSGFHKAKKKEGGVFEGILSLTRFVCSLVGVSPLVYKRRDEVIVMGLSLT